MELLIVHEKDLQDKEKIVQVALTEASKILISTMIFIDAPNFINGTIINDATGETYKLKFERIKLNVDKNDRPKEGE